MAETLTQGTVEFLIIDVTDQLHNLLSLVGTNPTFDVLNAIGTPMIVSQNATPQGMSAYCLIDTTTPSLWPAGPYRLYITASTPPENPRLGPYQFTVDNS